MIERVWLALALLALCAAVYRLLLARQLRRVRQSAPADPLLAHVPAGMPAIVYFTTPTCAPCRLYIAPMLKQLQAEVGEQHLHIIRVDATQDPDAAERWGVFSVPTVFVLDSNHQPRGVYDGGVTSAALRQALVSVM
jgi:thiol-disulfide isomerase/thioredoxin